MITRALYLLLMAGIIFITFYINILEVKDLKRLTAPKSINNMRELPKEYVGMKFWSTDFHISPIQDIKSLFAKNFEGIEIIDKSLSHHCFITNTCNSDLRVLTRENGITLGDCPNELRSRFYEEYINDEQFREVDAIFCLHASSMCELYMPFDKPMVVIASTRFDIGRYDHANKEALTLWIKNIQLIASKPHNVIGANNLYDVQYIKYFTGISNVLLLPSTASYLDGKVVYDPVHMEYLIGPSRGVHITIVGLLQNRIEKHNKGYSSSSSARVVKATLIRDLYVQYTFEQLASHMGVIIIPYQVSLMSFYEYYRLGIPIFVPSARLLTKWHVKYNMLNERTWDLVNELYPKQCSSIIPKAITSSNSSLNDTSTNIYSDILQYDPNDECSQEAIHRWLQLSDYYIFPHLIEFNSLTELVGLLSLYQSKYQTKHESGAAGNDAHSLTAISKMMLQHINVLDVQVSNSWNSILKTIKAYNTLKRNTRFRSVNEALSSLYGIELDMEQCYGMHGNNAN